MAPVAHVSISVTLPDGPAALSNFICDMTFFTMRVETRNTSEDHTREPGGQPFRSR